jgi:hypothetical protein
VLAGFLRLYHSGDEKVVAEATASLLRGHVPFVETFGDEVFGVGLAPRRRRLAIARRKGNERRAISSRPTARR